MGLPVSAVRRPFVAVAAISAALLLLADTKTAGQQASQSSIAAGTLAVQATSINALRTWDTFVTTSSRSGALRLRSTNRDPALPARVVERFNQFHDGVPIWGADIVRDSERGVPLAIFGMLAPELTLTTQPTLSSDAARPLLLATGGPDAVLVVSPELVIVRLDTGDYRLAYGAVVAGATDVSRVFVDAHTGGVLMQYTEIQRQQALVGTGTGVLGDQKKISVDTIAGTYVTFDRHRPPIIQTFDMRGNLNRTKLMELGFIPYTTSDLASDTDNVWTDPSVVDAQVHVSWTYDYYYKRFGRNGLDGRNGPINIVVNAVSQQGSLSLSAADFFGYATNANWCGVCGPGGQGRIFFGSGIPPGFFLSATGKNYTYFSGALDIAAHELTHAVIGASSGLVYRNESGALNEAFSDMMGKSVEFFYHPPGGGVGQADYVMGKDISRAARAGVLNGDRSMADPGLYGDPDHYSRRYVGSEDNGGVHSNSGIANQAFFLAIEGGTNRTSGLTVQGVGGANRLQIERVFYRAFTLLMPGNSTFAIARSATVQAARDLYGEGSAVDRAVLQSWTAVGVQ